MKKIYMDISDVFQKSIDILEKDNPNFNRESNLVNASRLLKKGIPHSLISSMYGKDVLEEILSNNRQEKTLG